MPTTKLTFETTPTGQKARLETLSGCVIAEFEPTEKGCQMRFSNCSGDASQLNGKVLELSSPDSCLKVLQAIAIELNRGCVLTHN